MKLYIIYNNGVVKIGITKHDDVQKRIASINKELNENNKFELIVDFDVNSNPAMIERLIHDYLGVNKLNIQYLKNELILVGLDHLNSQQDGYTEFFLADKDKIKQVVTLFGVLDYIDVNLEKLNKLDFIKGYSFDFFVENHSNFLKICNPIKQEIIKKEDSYYNTPLNTLEKSISNIENEKINADFCVEKNQYYLILGENKINIDELDSIKNSNLVKRLFKNKHNIISIKKSANELYSLIRKLKEENKETSLQPLVSMQKELKESKFNEFMNENNGYYKVRKLLEPWFDGGIFAEELIGNESTYYYYLKELLNETELDKNSKKSIEDSIKRFEKEKNLFQPNFDSTNVFPKYLSLVEKDNYNFEYYEPHNNMIQSIKIISTIFKIIYNSKDKEEELKKIDDFMDYIGTYHRKINDSTYPIKNGMSLDNLEENISNFIRNNKNYLDLSEVTVKIFGDYWHPKKNETKTLNKLTNLKNK